MENKRICTILEAVAKKEQVSFDEVVYEIEQAISAVYQKAKLENDQETIKTWAQIPCSGDMPTAVELIDFLSYRVYQAKENCFEMQDLQIEDDREGRPHAETCG